MNLTIANTSTTINDVAFANAIAAINLQVSRDFQPIWNVAATIAGTKFALDGSPAAVNTPTDAIIYLGDRSDDPTTGVDNAFGYHSANFRTRPVRIRLFECLSAGTAKIGAALCHTRRSNC